MNTYEQDFSDPSGDSAEALSRDAIQVRSMLETDLPAMVSIDRKLNGTGEARTRYYEGKLAEVLGESGVRVSLVAEVDGAFAGFIMARVDYGEYGRTAPSAVLDTIGVEPAFQGRAVGRMLMRQLLANLACLNVETLYTRTDWNDHDTLAFFEAAGFEPAQRLSFQRAL